ncbi:hypothetical protein AB0N39_06510, partial [Streptomyces cellulosae]
PPARNPRTTRPAGRGAAFPAPGPHDALRPTASATPRPTARRLPRDLANLTSAVLAPIGRV